MRCVSLLWRESGSVGSRWTSYALRAFVAAALLAVLAFTWIATFRASGRVSPSEMSAVGRRLFEALFPVQLILVSLAGPIMAGGLIAEERERGTLDLLLLTPLGGLEIVFSKFLLRVLYLLELLLLALPVMLGTLLFGGVSIDDLLLSTLFAASIGVWSAALATFFSTVSGNSTRAILRTYGLLLLQGGLIPMTWSMPALAAALLCPQGYAIDRILRAGPPLAGAMDLWPISVGTTIIASLLMVAASSRLLLRPLHGGTSRETADSPAPGRAANRGRAAGWIRRAEPWIVATIIGTLLLLTPWALRRSVAMTLPCIAALALVAWREVLRRRRGPVGQRRVWDDPIAWKEVAIHRSGATGRAISVTLLTLAALLLAQIVRDPDFLNGGAFHGAFMGLEIAAALLAGVMLGSVAWSHEAEGRQLDLISLTPLRPGKVVFGKGLGIALTIWPLALFPFLHGVAAVFTTGAVRMPGVLLAMLVFASMLAFHTLLALYLGLRQRRTGIALGQCLAGSLVLYLFLPWLVNVLSGRGFGGDARRLLDALNPFFCVFESVCQWSPEGASFWYPTGQMFAIGVYVPAAALIVWFLVRRWDTLSRRG